MGATASLQPKVYKFMKCGCIYCYDFSNNNPESIQLLGHCFNCLKDLKRNRFDISIVNELATELSRYSEMGDLLYHRQTGWMNQSSAIEEAVKRDMRGIDEFLHNKNILETYNIKCRICHCNK